MNRKRLLAVITINSILGIVLVLYGYVFVEAIARSSMLPAIAVMVGISATVVAEVFAIKKAIVE